MINREDSLPIPVITIDGPAASGKSSVSRLLAKKLHWRWVSTGAFYRGLGWVALHEGINTDDENKLAAKAYDKSWRVVLDADSTQVWFGDRDVTSEIKSEAVGAVASLISQYGKVRSALLDAQRQCAQEGAGLVAEGRDCGTVVFPQAILKVYLTASESERAQRRAAESGQTSGDLLVMQKARDQQDSLRKNAPLAVPSGALLIDSSQMALTDVVENIYRSFVDFNSRSNHKS